MVSDLQTDIALHEIIKEERLEAELAQMSADLKIQKELKRINCEFAPTEGDGL